MTGIRTRALILAAIVTAACGARPRVVPESPAVVSAEAARAVLERREAATKTLTALFRVTLRTPDGTTETSRGALVVERPDRLRLQIFSLGTITVYDYAVDGDRYRVKRPLSGETRSGRLSELGPSERELLRYDLRPLFLRGGLERAAVREDGAKYVISVDRPGGRRVTELSKASGRITGDSVEAGGRLVLRARYGDYRPIGGIELPFSISVEYPEEKVALAIEVSRYTTNDPVDEGLFRP